MLIFSYFGIHILGTGLQLTTITNTANKFLQCVKKQDEHKRSFDHMAHL